MRMTPQMSANFCWKKMEEIIEKINYYIQLMLMYAQTFGKVKATVFSSAQMKNFQQRGTDPKNQTNKKHSTYPC